MSVISAVLVACAECHRRLSLDYRTSFANVDTVYRSFSNSNGNEKNEGYHLMQSMILSTTTISDYLMLVMKMMVLSLDIQGFGVKMSRQFSTPSKSR